MLSYLEFTGVSNNSRNCFHPEFRQSRNSKFTKKNRAQSFHISAHLSMIFVRVLTFYLIFGVSCLSLLGEKEKGFQEVYIKGVRCNVSDKFAYQNFSCFPKSYNRSFSTMNIIGTTKFPLNNIHVSYTTLNQSRRFYLASILTSI